MVSARAVRSVSSPGCQITAGAESIDFSVVLVQPENNDMHNMNANAMLRVFFILSSTFCLFF